MELKTECIVSVNINEKYDLDLLLTILWVSKPEGLLKRSIFNFFPPSLLHFAAVKSFQTLSA